MENYDIICIGAGPTGLACAIEARRAGMRPLGDRQRMPVQLDLPLSGEHGVLHDAGTAGDRRLAAGDAAEKPTRVEALKYYRRAAEHYDLELRLFETVLRVDGSDGNFTVVTRDREGDRNRNTAKKIVVATGYYDLPNELGIPGENLPHVSHYYTEPHEYLARTSRSRWR